MNKIARTSGKKWGEVLVLVAVWAGLIALFSLLRASFFTTGTLGSIANRLPALAVVATGMTVVMITGGIDLSVGSVLGLCGAVTGVMMVDHHWPLSAALMAAMSAGAIIGWINGAVSVKLRLPSFIVTLGMLEIARGLAFEVTGSETKYIGAAVESLGAPIPGFLLSPAFVIALAVIVMGQVMLSHTALGRHLIALGANREAAEISGVRTEPPRIFMHVLLGLLTGLAAVFNCSRLGSADPNAGVGFELSAIAAAVVGGTSLMGGRGSVVKTFLGVLIIATLEAGLVQVGVSEPMKRIVTGSVIVLAVLADGWRRR